jgi:hypothetical protein
MRRPPRTARAAAGTGAAAARFGAHRRAGPSRASIPGQAQDGAGQGDHLSLEQSVLGGAGGAQLAKRIDLITVIDSAGRRSSASVAP